MVLYVPELSGRPQPRSRNSMFCRKVVLYARCWQRYGLHTQVILL